MFITTESRLLLSGSETVTGDDSEHRNVFYARAMRLIAALGAFKEPDLVDIVIFDIADSTEASTERRAILLYLLVVFLDHDLFQRVKDTLSAQKGLLYFLATNTSQENPIADEWIKVFPDFDTDDDIRLSHAFSIEGMPPSPDTEPSEPVVISDDEQAQDTSPRLRAASKSFTRPTVSSPN